MPTKDSIPFKRRRLAELDKERESLIRTIAAYEEKHGECLTMPQLMIKADPEICHFVIPDPAFSLDGVGAGRIARFLRIFAERNGIKDL